MLMNLKNLSPIKRKLNKYLKDKDILDIILFGSLLKGKSEPQDIDIAIITEKHFNADLPGFHVSIINPKDFFINPPSLAHTLLREGYSLKNNKQFSENFRFSNKTLFKYELIGLNPSLKVKIVNILRGKGKERGMVESNNGEWLSNQVFFANLQNEYLFEKFFIHFKVKFKKFYVLIH